MNELLSKKYDSEEEDEEYIPTKKELEEDKIVEIVKKSVDKSKIDDIWSKLKNKSSASNTNINSKINNQIPEEIIKIASTETNKTIDQEIKIVPIKSSIEEEIQKAIMKSKEIKNKITTETVHFAGQKFEYQKILSEEDLKKIKDKEKKRTHAGLDNLIDQLDKKNNINTYTKTKKDWNNYVEEKKIEKDLDYNRKDGFLSKKQFIEETNYKISENKKTVKRQKKE
jgi:hypothetical protein